MSISRRQPGVNDPEYGPANEDYEFSEADYMQDKRMCQDRSGYPPVSDERLAKVAVDEKLPSGSQSY